MNLKRVVIVSTALVVIAAAIFFTTRESKHDAMVMPHGPKLGSPAINFTLPTLTNGSFTLSNLRGSPTILTFGASWCEPCRREYPLFEAARSRNADLRVVGVLERDSPSLFVRFMKSVGAHWPVGIDDGRGSLAARYGVNVMPDTYFINSQGLVEGHVIGEISSTTLDTNLAAILAPLR